jgi:NAD(P)H dehydrogenase (quinone)
MSYAILRNSWYIENYLIGAEAAIAQGELLGSTGDALISGAARSDYAEAAAVVLTGGVAGNRILELAGDTAFTLADVAAALSRVSGRSVVFRNLPEAEYRDALAAGGVPMDFAAALAEFSAKAAGGTLADHSGTLGRLIGRPTRSLIEVFDEALASAVAGQPR